MPRRRTTKVGLAATYASAYNDDEKAEVLHAGFIGLDLYSSADPGEGQPVDVFRCAFELPDDRSTVRFDVRTVDASCPELIPLVPPPHFGYRLE